MPTAPTIDIEAWLVPIPGDCPSGRSLAYEPEYKAIREARRTEDATSMGVWSRPTKVADWGAVVALAEGCFRTKTKDLQIASWVTEALARLHSFAGLRDGFILMHEIQERFWETYYPQIDDGDLESRFGPFEFLNDSKLLPYLIRSIPVTHGEGEVHYSFDRYEESRKTENELKKSPDKAKVVLAEGRISAKQFDDQVTQTPRAFYEPLVADLKQAIEAFETLDRANDTRFQGNAPSLLNVGKILTDVLRLLEPILATKRQLEPDPEPTQEITTQEPEETAAEDASAEPSGEVRKEISRSAATIDPGRVIMEFRSLAQQLAEAGAKLEDNRKKYQELQAELRKLDEEYEQISRTVGRNGETHELLSRVLKLNGRG